MADHETKCEKGTRVVLKAEASAIALVVLPSNSKEWAALAGPERLQWTLESQGF